MDIFDRTLLNNQEPFPPLKAPSMQQATDHKDIHATRTRQHILETVWGQLKRGYRAYTSAFATRADGRRALPWGRGRERDGWICQKAYLAKLLDWMTTHTDIEREILMDMVLYIYRPILAYQIYRYRRVRYRYPTGESGWLAVFYGLLRAHF